MMNFPEKTILNRIMPKAKFMKMAELTTISRNELNSNIDRIILANVLRKDTINIEQGENINEIDVLELTLKKKSVSDNLIKDIDSNIPKHIIYCLHYEDVAQLVITFKKKNVKNDKYKVIQLYKTDWISYDNLNLDIKGLNLDEVFENFISQIAGDKIELKQETTLKEVIEKSVDIEKLQKKITALENKISKEKQFNKQLELKKELKELKAQMGAING